MKAETINKYKSQHGKTLRHQAKYWFNRFIRLRDTDEHGYGRCISSGQPLRFGNSTAQAGHLYSGGKFRALEFNEDNVNLQGKSDNYFNSGNETMYLINLTKKIGKERVEKLQQLAQISKRTPFKEDRFKLIEIIETYKLKVKEISKTKMFEI